MNISIFVREFKPFQMKRLLAHLILTLSFLGSLHSYACDPIVITASIIHENDCGNGANGSIDISIIGGDAPYSYTWTNGDTIEDISNLSAGTYGITVHDVNNCPGYGAFVVNLTDTIQIMDQSIYPSCAGELGTGIVSVTGGNSPYVYNWSNGSLDSFANNLDIGFHQVVVTDASGCQDSLEIEIISNPELQVFPIIQHSICFSDNGSVELLILGGTLPYEINWNGVDSTNIIPGTYMVSVTDLSGCEKEINYTILSEDELEIDLSVDLVSCDSNWYSAAASISGGVPPYQFSWSVSDTLKITSGVHSVLITDSLGCVLEKEFTVDTVESLLNVDYTYGNVSCQDTIIDVTITIEGGVSPYQIVWSDSTLNIFTKSVHLGQNESVKVIDDRGCEFDVNFDISGPGQIHLKPQITHASCGENNGAIVFNASGGVGNYIYTFNTFNVAPSVNNLEAKEYSLTVQDAQGCTLDTVIVIENIAVSKLLNYKLSHNTCSTDSSGSVTVLFDNDNLDYKWSNGDTTNFINELNGGDYTLTITDSLGCEWDTTFVIQKGSEIAASFSNTFLPCELNGDDGVLTVFPTGGIEPYTFLWNDGTEEQELIIDSVGNYSVTVFDSIGCSGMFNIQVNGDPVSGNICFQIPNAFSPNNDGINDTWQIKGINVFPQAKIQIFDRWGKLIIDQLNYNSEWDGKIDGNEVEMGSYFYIIDLQDSKTPVFKGLISIKR